MTIETESYSRSPANGDVGAEIEHATSLEPIEPRHYERGEEIGRGGMGRVIGALDRRLGREVAIKELLDTRPDRVRRFEREARITARLQHPAIIHVYEAGRWPDGTPFYAMPRVIGRSLDRVIADAARFADRLGLVRHAIAVVDALAYAHAAGIVHRDLKPSNVLVGEFGETVVIDWGLATELADADATAEGSIVGTPAYMAPEQARGARVDPRADVYSLGAVLYHVLTGFAPYEKSTLEMVAAEAAPPVRTRDPAVPLDLAAIVDKAMAREPAVRYRDAGDMGADLKRFETGQLVAARHYTIGQRIARTLWRHKLVVAFATVLVAVGAISVARIAIARDDAEQARVVATARNDQLVLLQARAELTRDPTAALAWLKRYPLSAPEWSTALQIASDARARGVARDVWNLDAIGPIGISPDDRTIAVGGEGGALTLIDIATGARRSLHADAATTDRVVFAPDGRTIVTTDHDHARLWDVASGRSRVLGDDHAGGSTIEFSSDGAFLTIRHNYAGSRLWKLPAGDELAFPNDMRRAISFVPHTHEIAMTTSGTNEVELFDLDTSRVIARTSLAGPPADVVVSGDGTWIGVAYGHGTSLFLWNPTTNAHKDLPASGPVVGWLYASPDGATFTSCGPDRTDLWQFDVASGKASVMGHEEGCFRQARAFSPDGSVFLSTGYGGALRLHLVAEGRTRELIGHEGAILDAAFSHDGRFLVSTAADHTVRIWDWRAGEAAVYHHTVSLERSSRDGRLFAQAPDGFTVIDLARGTREAIAADPSTVKDIGLSANGRFAVMLLADHTVVRLDVNAHTRRATVPLVDPGADADSALSADGRLFAFVSVEGVLRIADLDTAQVREVARLGDRVFVTLFSDDGRELAVGSRDGTARVLDVATGTELGRIRAPGVPWNAAFSFDGKRLATAWLDGIVRVLDLGTGAVRELRGHVGGAIGVEIAPDGHVLSSGTDGTVRSWDLDRGTDLIVRRAPYPINSIHVIAGTSLVVESARYLELYVVWDLAASPPPDATPVQLVTWLSSVTSARVDLDGSTASTVP
ncbi:MAG TPA: serine/threonine-protein kinase [Kofleriaceae bacterium]